MLTVYFGDACGKFFNEHMRNLALPPLEFNAQWNLKTDFGKFAAECNSSRKNSKSGGLIESADHGDDDSMSRPHFECDNLFDAMLAP